MTNRCDPSRKHDFRPDTQSIPENRRGTKTYYGYLMHMIKGNYPSGNVERVMAMASHRQTKKAHKIVELGTHWKQVKGRSMRALVRASWQDYGEHADGYFGHP